ncbi:glycosyltransferase family 4 protein [Candidatus Roizmanbacteria bacterium]|nr:glycosyltransferase family 4 protein [Candidatus Roizmanbacteria bacterium]
MQIGIDGNNANVVEQVGVSVYTRNLLAYFQKNASSELQFKVFLKQKPLAALPPATNNFSYEVVPGPVAWSTIFLPLRLFFRRDIDIFFAPAHYSPSYIPCPLVVTIHDLSYIYFPHEFLQRDLYKLTNWTKKSVEKAAKIIAVSKTTKKDMMKQYGLKDEQVAVIYNGFEKNAPKQPIDHALLKHYELTEKQYIFYVGTLQPRKNITTLIKAFAKFRATHPETKLVLTGKKGWLYDQIFQEAASEGLQNSVVFTGYLGDEELVTLYKHAFCFVLPSLYEGFGIPILEAMAQDCPVLTSFTSSLPEIGGEACLYFDPKSDIDLLDKLNLLSENKELRKDLIQKGKNRIKDFSWETCAKETLDTLISAEKI